MYLRGTRCERLQDADEGSSNSCPGVGSEGAWKQERYMHNYLACMRARRLEVLRWLDVFISFYFHGFGAIYPTLKLRKTIRFTTHS